ncbi:Bax inhibitor-1/YccA family protein [Propionicicella superfundia]|uniref:Bax inhibitor-1/YccA family protein n=1 Tax=Propionicicella superfundia TaxID=348582 RepID=UPI003CCB97D6
MSRPDVWSPNGGQTTYPTYAQPAGQMPGQGSAPQYDQYGQPVHYAQQPVTQQAPGVMTLDDVVLKTGILFAILAASAAATWLLVPDALLYPALIVSSIAGFVTVLFVSLRRKVQPAFVFLYALVEGVFIGAISKIFESLYTGIVGQAILATFVAAGVTLAAYKFLKIRVTPMFQRVVMIATISFAVLLLVNFVFAMFGAGLGIRTIGSGAGLLAIAVSAIAVVLAVLNLILDFDHIQRGIEMRAPAEQSWVAAFGLMVTMVWLYVELLRILSYFRD